MSEPIGAEQPGDPTDPTALGALTPLATSEVALTATLRHRETYTTRGLLSVFWHEPPVGVETRSAALVLCGGAMGGVLGLILLDETVVGVALPTMQRDLGLSVVGGHWVVNAYLLVFAGLTAAGGRLGDDAQAEVFAADEGPGAPSALGSGRGVAG